MKLSALPLAIALLTAGARSQTAPVICDRATLDSCIFNGFLNSPCEPGNGPAAGCAEIRTMFIIAQNCYLSFCPQPELLANLQNTVNIATART